MSIFQKRELSTGGGTEPTPPRAAVCFTTSAMTRRAADWLARLGGCRPLGILSDHGEDVIWQCEAENVDLLLLETDFSPAAEDTKDVSARCRSARCIWPARTAARKSCPRWTRRWSWL